MAKKVTHSQPPEPEAISEVTLEEPIVELPKEIKARYFIATRVAMWHPYKSVRIENLPIELEYDSWVESQHQAGMLKEVY